ncbi:hypothetical protein TBLA_0I02720 [Henningerozyma blattae CBS 6284]|uniref:F-box domain-containing protein n=1 Tax=Henningerozyma blattae (strain ATCC 34711 / CBS 6284 / DSM 70876 / NBRC 10599 / NRRL Y-10934 / UCD 77-7) TaxID=1071380 RepID=I2H976_HENB6|nr:hypothetical protein TBLA_0I02720 [Tetrapisispora blattae CBS 6284]CCH62928.1 hypothetical protein TBLA_0I02720 [Tetrapisispora blattae CBS 6284]
MPNFIMHNLTIRNYTNRNSPPLSDTNSISEDADGEESYTTKNSTTPHDNSPKIVDFWVFVSKYLNIKDVQSLTLTNKTNYSILSDDYIWKDLYMENFFNLTQHDILLDQPKVYKKFFLRFKFNLHVLNSIIDQLNTTNDILQSIRRLFDSYPNDVIVPVLYYITSPNSHYKSFRLKSSAKLMLHISRYKHFFQLLSNYNNSNDIITERQCFQFASIDPLYEQALTARSSFVHQWVQFIDKTNLIDEEVDIFHHFTSLFEYLIHFWKYISPLKFKYKTQSIEKRENTHINSLITTIFAQTYSYPSLPHFIIFNTLLQHVVKDPTKVYPIINAHHYNDRYQFGLMCEPIDMVLCCTANGLSFLPAYGEPKPVTVKDYIDFVTDDMMSISDYRAITNLDESQYNSMPYSYSQYSTFANINIFLQSNSYWQKLNTFQKLGRFPYHFLPRASTGLPAINEIISNKEFPEMFVFPIWFNVIPYDRGITVLPFQSPPMGKFIKTHRHLLAVTLLQYYYPYSTNQDSSYQTIVLDAQGNFDILNSNQYNENYLTDSEINQFLNISSNYNLVIFFDSFDFNLKKFIPSKTLLYFIKNFKEISNMMCTILQHRYSITN